VKTVLEDVLVLVKSGLVVLFEGVKTVLEGVSKEVVVMVGVLGTLTEILLVLVCRQVTFILACLCTLHLSLTFSRHCRLQKNLI